MTTTTTAPSKLDGIHILRTLLPNLGQVSLTNGLVRRTRGGKEVEGGRGLSTAHRFVRDAVGRELTAGERTATSDQYFDQWFTVYSRIRRFDRKAKAAYSSSLKVGDRVKVTARGSQFDDAPGFDNVWVKTMDSALNNTYTIKSIDSYGVVLENRDSHFPPQALSKVK